jgi:hypothetical protein
MEDGGHPRIHRGLPLRLCSFCKWPSVSRPVRNIPTIDPSSTVAGVEARFRNNIIVSSGTAVPLKVERSSSKLRFEQNLYWREEAPIEIRWDGRGYPTLSAWREATGQESLNGQPVGFVADPLLRRARENPPLVTRDGRNQLTIFRPRRGSVVLGTGMVVPSGSRLTAASSDILGALLSGQKWPLGAVSEPLQD